jgi:PIN domain nuclease of toxin-antitoxin system
MQTSPAVVIQKLEKNLLKVALSELFQKTETELQIEMVTVEWSHFRHAISLNPFGVDPRIL